MYENPAEKFYVLYHLIIISGFFISLSAGFKDSSEIKSCSSDTVTYPVPLA